MKHGWLNLDKPLRVSSARAVNRVKKILGIKKAGHLGTLDPLASGVLPIALGEATKTVPYLASGFKAYSFTVQWGMQTATDDCEGEVIKSSNVRPNRDQIGCAIKNFIGEIKQVPPDFSAIKINGIRAYSLARNRQAVEVKSRLVHVRELKLVSIDVISNSANFFILCGSGVYIRSIARDLGIALQCFGYVSRLRRTMVGNFQEIHSIKLEQLTESNVIPIEHALKGMSTIKVSLSEAEKIKKGQHILLNSLYSCNNHDTYYVVTGDVSIAICSLVDGYMKPIRVFNV